MTIYLPSFASIAHDSTIASSDTVGELTSSLVVYSLCGHLSAHPMLSVYCQIFLLKTKDILKLFFSCPLSCLIIERVL